MKVLIVDDTGSQRFIIKKLFVDAGILASEIDDAENGEKALIKVLANTYSVILLDWNMPVMDGLEFLKNIRQRNIMIPVIMVTSESEESKKDEAKELGANHFLTKPFTGIKLMELAKQYLS